MRYAMSCPRNWRYSLGLSLIYPERYRMTSFLSYSA